MQRCDQWYLDKCGKITASAIADLMAGGRGLTRRRLLRRLAVERFTGVPIVVTYPTAAMRRGVEMEDQARANYEILTGRDVVQTGYIGHPDIPMSGASPDGLVGDDGLIEIKCPLPENHIATLFGDPPDRKYMMQMQWQMACTGRQWCDFVSYCPLETPLTDMVVPDSDRLDTCIVRVPRDDDAIAEVAEAVAKASAEIDELVNDLDRLTSGAASNADG